MLCLITGASGSGKSEYAETLICRLAQRDGICRKVYMATMEGESAAARQRIARHRKLRAGKGFLTVESLLGLGNAEPGPAADRAGAKPAVLLLECLSSLLANLMFSEGMDAEAAVEEIVSQAETAKALYRHTVIVTDEIFSDGVEYGEGVQAYCRGLGLANQRLAEAADLFCEVVYSIPLYLKGEAVCRF